jgi:hypothetical protein
MRAFHSFCVVSLASAALLALPVHAAKPVDHSGLPYGNGFPSGPHFNLNFLGKKDGFNCPPPEYDASGAQIFGNVVFMPRAGGVINVLIESGRKGPRSAPDSTKLEVTDWCTESFPDDGEATGDPAKFQLPAHDAGYALYARITGKPGTDGGPSATFQPPELYYVEDEAGNDLVLLGLVTKDGVSTVAADGTVYRTSTDTSKKGKGVQKATDISALFEWSGEICYLQSDTDGYCLDATETNLCVDRSICCVDENSDGIYESCVTLTDGTCPDSTQLVTATCRTFTDEWIFNVGDFVGALWPISSTGAYNIQIRAYPL